ncbi:MAG: KTSC domain-containing protein [Akkermansiaceae bacterium]|nr:KTSC domain-containing protein [Akkermansiaceae bacterium]MCP5537240.1 KTSC domain-containing protein [Akkermansiaceae bacterium]
MSNITTLTKVDSSMIYAIGYDEKNQILEAVFTRGGIWEYHNFPKEAYQSLIDSDSIGSHMRYAVLGCYDEVRVS